MSPTEQTLQQELMAHGMLRADVATAIASHAQKQGTTWVRSALQLSAIPTQALADALQRTLGHPHWRSTDADLQALELDLWSPPFCLEHRLLAWRDDDGAHHVATADPTDLVVMTQAQAQLDAQLHWWVAAHDELEQALLHW